MDAIKREYGKEYYKQNKKYILRRRVMSSILFPLAYIGYKALMNKHGEVTHDIINQYVRCTKISSEKAIKFFKELENPLDITI